MSLDDAPPPGLLSEDVRSSRPALDPEQVAAQSGWVRAVARNLVRDPWGAEDVAQEALLAALAAPPREVPDDLHLRAWLGRVAFNLSRLDLRSGGRRRARERVVARREALPSPVEELEAAAARGELARALRALEAPGRQVLQLRYFDGLTTAEIAVRLKISELAVRKRLWRAREKLRESLEPRRRNLHGGLLLAGLRRFARLEVAGLAAAGATAFFALEHDLARQDARAPELVAAHGAALPGDAPQGGDGQTAGVAGSGSRGASGTTGSARQPLVPSTPSTPPRDAGDDPVPPRAAHATGLVLDLEGTPQPGLEVFARDLPERVLAWTDGLGGFVLEAPLEAELEARGAGLVTLVPGRTRPGAEEALVLVASAAPFQATVLDAEGAPLASATLELVARETAFARLDRPVQLVSPVLRHEAVPQATGTLVLGELARAEGLFLRVSCPGFEPREWATLSLGSAGVFELEREPAGPEVVGTVVLADGRPAAGARVRLALAETTTDARGAFHLPLRGVGPATALEVRGRGYAPLIERDLVRRHERGELRDGLALVLDRPLDPVRGSLQGAEAPYAGWRVLAFVDGANEGPYEARCDAAGAFEFELPRGAAEFHALAPDRLESHSGTLADTRSGTFALRVEPKVHCDERLALRADDGRPLAGAEVELLLELAPGRSVPWGRTTSDGAGQLGYARALGSEVGLSVGHVRLGPRALAVAAAPELVLPRARAVRIVGAEQARAFRVLDAEGVQLAADGPLGPAETFALQDGLGALTFVPPAARWLELFGSGAPQRLALVAEPGASVTLVP